MEEQKDMIRLLDMMTQPVFFVKDFNIVRANEAARQLLPELGTDLLPLLGSSAEAYREFSGGCLYLPLTVAGLSVSACVRRLEEFDLFELDTGDTDTLRAMALAASALRKPLSSALSGASSLLDSQEDPETLRQLSLLNRNLHQILRLLGNMSDADYAASHCRAETTDLSALFREIFEKAGFLFSRTGLTLSYQDLPEPVYGLADRDQLERAVLNILSNAAKFTPKGGHIDASLTRRGSTLHLSVQDSGSGIAQEVMSGLFRRHLRQPGIEDSRFGLGLGIHMIHAAARNHGGTLLITQGETGGTRVILTLAIRQKEGNSISSPIFRVDYTGGFDHSLVELSDCLPAELFDGSF